MSIRRFRSCEIQPFENIVEKNVELWAVRFGAVLFGIFGVIALLLAAVGVYGVKAYAVARRTREIGIRMALGADRRDVFALIMKQGALQTAFALGVGLLLSLGLGRVLAQMLYQVSPMDPVALSRLEPHARQRGAARLFSAGPPRDAGEPDDGVAHGITAPYLSSASAAPRVLIRRLAETFPARRLRKFDCAFAALHRGMTTHAIRDPASF